MRLPASKIPTVHCPLTGKYCDKKCPAWTSKAITTENINVKDENKGFCKKFSDFDENGKLRV